MQKTDVKDNEEKKMYVNWFYSNDTDINLISYIKGCIEKCNNTQEVTALIIELDKLGIINEAIYNIVMHELDSEGKLDKFVNN